MDTKTEPEYICLTIVRHGECTSNIDPLIYPQDEDPDPLTSRGKKQVTDLAEKFSDLPIDQIFCSEYERAIDTAKAIADANSSHPSIQPTDRLKERMHGEEVTRLLQRGKENAACYALYGPVSNPPQRDWTPEGGESLNDVANRARVFTFAFIIGNFDLPWKKGPFDINQWREKQRSCGPTYVPDGIANVVIVGHNVFLTEMYEALRDWNISDHTWSTYHLQNAEWTRHIIERRRTAKDDPDKYPKSSMAYSYRHSVRLYPLQDRFWGQRLSDSETWEVEVEEESKQSSKSIEDLEQSI